MTFVKGKSGNPGGRPKEIKEIKALAQSHGQEAIEALVRVALHGKSESARVQAATALLERGFGKPMQQVEVGKPGEFDEMDAAALRAYIAEEADALGLSVTPESLN